MRSSRQVAWRAVALSALLAATLGVAQAAKKEEAKPGPPDPPPLPKPVQKRIPLNLDKPVPGASRIVVDVRIPEYRRIETLAGKVRSVGSSTLSNLLNRWTQDFKLIYPKVEYDIVSGGSSAAPAALAEGRAELGPMTRPMNDKELADFTARFGYAPTQLTVGLDALAVYVHKANPLQQISLKQLDGIYSISHKRGSIETRMWGQLGLGGEWREAAIAPKGPASYQGSYSIFRESVLQGGDYRYDLAAEPVPTAIVQAVGTEPGAIGFASHFYRTRRTRTLAIGETEAGPFYQPTQQNCVEGKYPLTRLLYIYVNKKPNEPLAGVSAHLLAFICSKQGQETAARDGNYPLSAALATKHCLDLLR